MYDDDVDVVFHAAGVRLGVFEAAAEADRLAIGVDSDQYLGRRGRQQKCMLTSMLKRVDLAVYDAIAPFVDGELEAGVQVVRPDATAASTTPPTGGQVDETGRRSTI